MCASGINLSGLEIIGPYAGSRRVPSTKTGPQRGWLGLHTGDPQKTESSIGSNDSARVPSTEVLSNQMLEDLEKI